MEILANHGTLIIWVAAIFGFLMAIGIGANDVANAMGTSVGSKALTIKQAILIAMVFEFAGAYLAGGEVTDTIRNTSLYAHDPQILVYGMMSALLAAGTWLLLASFMGWPVSTTHSIIGAIIGFACVSVGTKAIDWSSIQGIVGSWLITPFIAGIFAYFIFMSAQKLIFDTDKPDRKSTRLNSSH